MQRHDDLAAPPSLAEEIFGEEMGGALAYARLLATTGVDHGLIGPREVPRLWERHILNCAVLKEVLAPEAVVGDIGSGAGLPGLAVAIARPDVDVHLIEPLARRTVWLEVAIAELGLTNVTVHRGRAESLAGELTCDVVTARAVARLSRLAEWAGPLLRPGGELIALKGSSAGQELEDDLPAIRKAGGVEPRIEVLGAGRLEVPTTIVRVRFPAVSSRPPRNSGKGRRASGRRGAGSQPARRSDGPRGGRSRA